MFNFCALGVRWEWLVSLHRCRLPRYETPGESRDWPQTSYRRQFDLHALFVFTWRAIMLREGRWLSAFVKTHSTKGGIRILSMCVSIVRNNSNQIWHAHNCSSASDARGAKKKSRGEELCGCCFNWISSPHYMNLNLFTSDRNKS